jgi:RecB family exonuclease
MFFEEIAEWGEKTGLAAVDRGPDVSEENPLVGYRERFVRDWPGPALREEADELFPLGWRRAAAQATRDPSSLGTLVAGLDDEGRRIYETSGPAHRSLAAHLMERETRSFEGPSLPASLSVGGVIDYARCPKRFYWSVVRPLPRFSGPAARIGTQIHAWIERKSSGQTSLLDLDEIPDLTIEELAREPGKIDRLQRNFQESRFAAQVPLYAERPFLLYLEGFVVGGRIDAIFGTPEGPWEVVDYKTGRTPPETDALSGLQLDLYALACTEVFGKRAEELTLTYHYLATGETVSRAAGDPVQTRDRTIAWLRSIAAREFEPTPGEHCRWCDFLAFCEAGQAFVEQKGEASSD